MRYLVKGACIDSGSERSIELEEESVDHAARVAKSQGVFPYLVKLLPPAIPPEQFREVTIDRNPINAEIKAFGLAPVASIAAIVAGFVLLSNWLRNNGNSGGSLNPSKYEGQLRRYSDQYGYSVESLELLGRYDVSCLQLS